MAAAAVDAARVMASTRGDVDRSRGGLPGAAASPDSGDDPRGPGGGGLREEGAGLECTEPGSYEVPSSMIASSSA